MELGKRIIQKIRNNNPIKDFFLFAIVTIIFHFLYWNTNMNQWLFGIYTEEVFDFFTYIAFRGTEILSDLFIPIPFDSIDNSLCFYDINSSGKEYICSMNVVQDCSGIKQIFQFFMIMLVVPNKLWKRAIYFLISCIVILVCNIIRIFSLTSSLIYFPSHYQFIHDWIGRPFHYIIIFILWVVWIERFSSTKNVKPLG